MAVAVGRGMRVEDTDIQECAFISASPKTTCFHVQMSTILSDGSGGRLGLSGEMLKVRLDSHIMANFREQTGSQITNLIVSD